MTLLQELKLLKEKEPRNSRALCALGEQLLQQQSLASLGQEQWNLLETLFHAAVDLHKLDLAHICADRLTKRFPGSPRVAPLPGMLLEAEGRWDVARQYYEKELVLDPTNILLRKRLISIHLHAPSEGTSKSEKLSVAMGIDLLVEYLDTVYTDAEAWEELAVAYASLGLYQQSLSALGDLLLLQPQNPFYTLRYAETAYTLQDLELAYHYYLKTLELCGMSMDGAGRRAAFGIKLCASKIKEGLPGSKAPSPHSMSGTPSPQRLSEIDALVTEKLLDAYTTGDWTQLGDSVSSPEDIKALRSWITTLVR